MSPGKDFFQEHGGGHSLLLLYWLLVLLAALFLRPLIPIDETRYVSVAWEMWQNGDFLVPHLNGATYAHKPPLLFWLIHLGWWLFGVNETWPRLIAPLLSLGCLYLTYRLARYLWPSQTAIADQAPWILFGTFVWLLFYTLVQFDLLLVLCTLLGLLGIWNAGEGKPSGWWLLSLAIGLGLLSKGPVILLHLLPATLLAPLWLQEKPCSWKKWYSNLLLSVLGGAAIVLAWAIPAAIKGGEAYTNAIFWGQTANRVVNSFAHKEPWWWYLPMLPVLLLPWSLWPRLWRSLLQLKTASGSQSIRFLACWILPVLLLFSFVSGKQIKYLLPLLPAFSLLIAWLISAQQTGSKRRRFDFPVWILLTTGVLLASLQALIPEDSASWAQQISPYWGIALCVSGIALAMWSKGLLQSSVIRIATASTLVIVCTHFALMGAAGEAYDLRSISQRIKQLQDAGHDIAYVGKYHGQFNFLGRLSHPVLKLNPMGARIWAQKHPTGYLVMNDTKGLDSQQMIYQQDYRGNRNALKIFPAPGYLQAINSNE